MIKGVILQGKYPSANLTFCFGKYELSIANDTSCNTDEVIRRSSFCIFVKDKNVTSDFYPGKEEIFGADSYMVLEAMQTLNKLK